jgi:nitroreductase
MELLEAIKGRRSTRNFKKQTIPDNAIETIIDAAICAPSAGNIQPWEFVIIKNPAVKEKLAEAALNQRHVEEAPVVIVVCADEKRSSMGYGSRGRTLYCLQDTAAATQNILLAAYSLGLGACWVGAFNEDEVKDILKAPEGLKPVAMVPLGYPNAASRQRGRRLLNQIVHYDGF